MKNENNLKKSANLMRMLINNQVLPIEYYPKIQSEKGIEGILFSAYATFLVLYKFPAIYDSTINDVKNNFITIIKIPIGIILGWLTLMKYLAISFVNLNCDRKTRERKIENNRIIILAFSKNQFSEVLAPIIDRILNATDKSIVIIHNGFVPEISAQKDRVDLIETNSAKNHYNFLEIFKFLIFINILSLKIFRRIFRAKENLSLSLSQFVQLYSSLHWLINREFPRVYNYILTAKFLSNQIKSDLILSCDDADQRNRIFFELSKNKISKIPKILTVQQGLTHKNYPEWVFSTSDYVACNGEVAAKAIQFQNSNTITFLTGHPAFDEFYHSDLINQKVESPARKNKYRILFASQPYYPNAFENSEIRIQMIAETLSLLSACSDFDVYIKPHPNEDLNEISKLISNLKVKIIRKDNKIEDSISDCDLFITMFSTSAFHAIARGKPVINVIYPHSNSNNPFVEWNATHIASTKAELSSLLSFFSAVGQLPKLKSPTERITQLQFLEKYFYKGDGLATGRIIELIERIT